MKKIKIFILLLVCFLLLPLKVDASEIETDENSQTQNLESEYPEVNELIAYYDSIIESLTTDLNSGAISQDEYNLQVSEIEKEKENAVANLETQMIIQEEKKDNETVNNADTSINKITMVDENGEVIKDYTNIDFSNMENKRTITFKCKMEDGTMPDSNLYVKITGSALNVIYTTSVVLDESNNFTAKMEVPNDIYAFDYEYSDTADSISYEEGFIDASTNPTRYIYIYGSRSILTNNDEIIKIEGNEYVEPEIEKTINYTLIIKIISGVIAISAIIIFVLLVIKKKRDSEF